MISFNLFILLFLIFLHDVMSLSEQSLVCGPSGGKESERTKVLSIPSSVVKELSMTAWESLSDQQFCHTSGYTKWLKPNITNERAVIVSCTNCPNCPGFAYRTEEMNRTLFVFVSTQKIPEWISSKAVWIQVERVASLERNSQCTLQDDPDALKSFSKTSVLFVSISFIILMVISLAWLVFYYVQRFRYAHAKDRLHRRLFNAAKKALNRMPAKTLRGGDIELEGDCPVCIDPYSVGDLVRTLPCRHVFHKTCIDPWLLEHRTCPMCKADILKAFGFHFTAPEGRRMDEDVPRERRISPEPMSIHEDGVRVVGEVHLPPSTSAVFIERTRPIRESSRPSSHIVNLVHVRARSSSCQPSRGAFRGSSIDVVPSSSREISPSSLPPIDKDTIVVPTQNTSSQIVTVEASVHNERESM